MFFGSCANKLVPYLFKTLPIATRFISDPMGFLIEVNVRKKVQNWDKVVEN